MRARALAPLCAVGLAVVLAAAEEEAGRPRPVPAPRAETTAAGACYLRFGSETACVHAATQKQCDRACDERLCDAVVWFYPKSGCWEWGWIGPSPR